MIKALLVLARVDLRGPYHLDVLCTDACREGYGVCQATWDAQSVREVFGHDERWRFKEVGRHQVSFRRGALQAADVGALDPL